MAIDFPTNTLILIIALMIGTGAGSWFMLSYGLQQLPITPSVRSTWRWVTAIVLITWLLGRLSLSVDPPGAAVLGTQYSFVSFTFLVLGLLVGIVPLLISPVFRRTIRAVPETWLVGIHAIRIGGFVWLALMDMQLLPAGFALPAGYGDITIGLLALVMVSLLAKGNRYARPLVMGWNVLGLVDFVVAITTAFIYMGTFTEQLTASGVSQLYLNYTFLIPSFGVPLFGLLHLYSLFQILSSRADKTKRGVKEPVQAPVLPGEQGSVHGPSL